MQLLLLSTIVAPSCLAFAFGPPLQHRPRLTSTSTSSSSQLSASLVRTLAGEVSSGPSAAKAIIDADRIAPMLNAMSSYAVVASLLMGSGLYLFAITPMKIKDYDFHTRKNSGESESGSGSSSWVSKLEKGAIQIFAVVSAISIATSLRTVIIMKIMTLYANTALGQKSGEQVFVNFWYSDLCMKLRASSFKSFITAIQSFRMAFALSVFLKTDGKHRYVATGVAVLIMIVSGIQLDQMIKLASSTIFS